METDESLRNIETEKSMDNLLLPCGRCGKNIPFKDLHVGPNSWTDMIIYCADCLNAPEENKPS